MDAFWIILTGSLVAVACGLPGSFLVLRRISMVGDAISHAVLPGIVIAFLIAGNRASLPMLAGAAFFGLFTTYFIEFLREKIKLQADSAIGISFTFLFAVGVILISYYAGDVDLDQECVLFGEIAYTPLDVFYLDSGVSLGPRAVWIIGGALLLIFAFIAKGFRGLYITTFDPEYARTIGISTSTWHYVLMGAVSLTTVVSFESVGAVLVVAFLVIPPATAYLWTNSLKRMLILTTLLGIASSAGGYFLAAALDASIAGSMASIAGIFFFISFFLKKRKKTRI